MDTILQSSGEIVKGPCTLRVPCEFSVFTGCYNEWGKVEYWQTGAFSIDLQTVRSASTCGSPIFSSGSWWLGFLCDTGGKVECDGKEVVFTFGEGQEALVYEDQPKDGSQWARYRELATERLEDGPEDNRQPGAHAYDWEYCTWVEQKRLAKAGQSPRTVINEGFVRECAERVLRLGLEPGKFTIDDGWQELGCDGAWTDGNWRPNEKAFPSLEKTCSYLKSEGFTPGLWFGMGWYPEAAAVRQDRPGVFGAWEPQGEVESNLGRTWSIAANAESESYLRETLRPYAEMGFRKFKFDFFYGERARTNAAMKTLYRAVRSLDPSIEIESHHPDFFFSRWTDTVRLNDVLIQPGRDWEGLTLSHMRVSQLCSPDRIMNLDHLGGNDPSVGEADFLRHIDILDTVSRQQARYPVLSLLPDRYSSAAKDRVKRFVKENQYSPVA